MAQARTKGRGAKKALAALWAEIHQETRRLGTAVVLANPTEYRDAINLTVFLEDGRALVASTAWTADNLAAGIALAGLILEQTRALSPLPEGEVTQAPDRNAVAQVAPQSVSVRTDGMCSPLRAARKAAKMTQADLEQLTGLTQAAISKIELRGMDYEHLELGNARLLAKALGTTVDALFPPKGGA